MPVVDGLHSTSFPFRLQHPFSDVFFMKNLVVDMW